MAYEPAVPQAFARYLELRVLQRVHPSPFGLRRTASWPGKSRVTSGFLRIPIFTTVPQMPLRPRLLWGAGQVYFLDTPDDGNRKGPRAVETQSSGVALKIQCQIWDTVSRARSSCCLLGGGRSNARSFLALASSNGCMSHCCVIDPGCFVLRNTFAASLISPPCRPSMHQQQVWSRTMAQICFLPGYREPNVAKPQRKCSHLYISTFGCERDLACEHIELLLYLA